ncbi:MAG: hypothetical protein CVU56_25585 [Deltaproteobacteria bacterium HGW-Deltaproteobacteria-14]|jgi:hypothetical protein|nr:MAG: hypothetical protein CVU56_25585 [Deltaproteobacteria bacterium HGW-Deltaproteobacteria-14]
MRRFITLTTIALSTLFAAPVLASPGGNGPGNGHGNGPASMQPSGPGGFGNHGDVGGPGYANPGHASPGYATPTFHPQPVQVLSRQELRKAEVLQATYSRQRAALVRQINVAERQLQNLQARRSSRPAQVRAAKVKVATLERKLSTLDLRYRMSLARFLTPVQIRYFLAVS